MYPTFVKFANERLCIVYIYFIVTATSELNYRTYVKLIIKLTEILII